MAKIQMVLNVMGAQYYDITDDKTGEIKRYTSLFACGPVEADKADRVGMKFEKFRCADSAIVQQLKAVKLPAEIPCDCEFNVNAKGEARIVVHAVRIPVAEVPAGRKAA